MKSIAQKSFKQLVLFVMNMQTTRASKLIGPVYTAMKVGQSVDNIICLDFSFSQTTDMMDT